MNNYAIVDPDLIASIAGNMLGMISRQQEALGLNNTEFGERAGLNRLTIQRSRVEDADPKLSTVIAMAVCVGLTPTFLQSGEGACQQHEAAVVHRGLSYNRLNRDPDWRDVQRETALAKGWEAANEYVDVGLMPILQSLLPNYTQVQASAAATVIQWLGSDVGFMFLEKALANAGYSITDTATGKRKHKS